MTEPKVVRRVSRFVRLKEREQARLAKLLPKQPRPAKQPPEQPPERTKAAPKRKTWLVLLPQNTPPLELMLGDIGSPDPEEIAWTLDVSRSTAYRWIKQGTAPRTALLALFYATQWGQSQVHARAHNDAVMQATIARNLLERLEAAERKLARLGQIGEFGSANDPAEGVVASHSAHGAVTPEPGAETGETDELIRKEILRFAK